MKVNSRMEETYVIARSSRDEAIQTTYGQLDTGLLRFVAHPKSTSSLRSGRAMT